MFPRSCRSRGPRVGGGRAGARWLAGGCAAAVYLGVMMIAWPFPIRLLYDGLVPLPPYRWVHPPASRARDNKPALSATGTVALGPPSRATEVATDDDQALVTFPEGAIAARPGESSAKVAIVPLDPVTVASAPGGRRFDGNAYRIEAAYAVSGAPVVLASPVTIVLRYPVHATFFLRSAGTNWEPLAQQVFTGSQQVLANTDRLGVFAAAALSNARRVGRGAGGTEFAALGAAVVGLIVAAVARTKPAGYGAFNG